MFNFPRRVLLSVIFRDKIASPSRFIIEKHVREIVLWPIRNQLRSSFHNASEKFYRDTRVS
eukprot:Pgem_evm1s15848